MCIHTQTNIHIYVCIWKSVKKSRVVFWKHQNNFFFWIFPYKCKVCIVCSENYFNLTKIFVLRLFKMAAKQTEWYRLEQESFTKFLVTRKCKPREIYWAMWNGWCFWRSMFELKKKLQKMKENGVKTHWLSGKEKVPVSAVSKEGHADSLLSYEKTHHYRFSWKTCNCIRCFLLPTLQAKFTLFIVIHSYV